METFTTEDLIEELRQYHQPVGDRREGGVTRREYADANNVSLKQSARQLDELVERGILIREKNRIGPNALGYVYYKNTE